MQHLFRLCLLLTCLTGTTCPSGADEKAPLARAELDARLDSILFDATALGVQLFNAGDQAGCYRVYQGSLMAVEAMLDHRPKLRDMLMTERQRAETMASMSDRAFTLRKAMDQARQEFKGGKMAARSLWDRLGGEPAVRAVVRDFIAVAAPDPKVNFTRNGKFQPKPEDVVRIEQRLVELISAVSGGPLKYTGKNMKDAHRGMAISDAEFDAAAGHLIAVLKKYNVPQKEMDELVGVIAATRTDIVETMRDRSVKRSLWDRLGGESAVRAVMRDSLALAAQDPKVNFTRDGRFKARSPADVTRVEQLLVEFVSEHTGGPLKYTGRAMKPLHASMKITDDEFNALGAIVISVMKKYDVPQKEIDELMGIIASTRADVVEVPSGAMTRKSLWDRLGGEPAVTAVIDDFVARAAANPQVNFTRKGTDNEWQATPENVARLKKRLVQFVSIASGGPLKYEGLDMKSAHVGMKITSAEFDALAADLKSTLDKFKVPAAEQMELLKAVGGTKSMIVEAK